MLGVLRADGFLWGRQYLRDIVPELTAVIDALVCWMLTYVLPDSWKAQEVTRSPIGTICGVLLQRQRYGRRNEASYPSSKQAPLAKHVHISECCHASLKDCMGQYGSIVLPQGPEREQQNMDGMYKTSAPPLKLEEIKAWAFIPKRLNLQQIYGNDIQSSCLTSLLISFEGATPEEAVCALS